MSGSGSFSTLRIALLDYRDVNHPEAGGAEQYLHEIFQRIAARGHRVTLLCARYKGAAEHDTIGRIRVQRVGNKATVNVLAARAGLRLARTEGVDLFVENICKIPFLMPWLTRVPVLPIVHHLFGHTVFYETNPFFASYVWLYERLIPLAYRNLRNVVVSESTARDLVRRGLRSSRTDVIYNGLDRESFLGGGEEQRSARPLLVYVGRLKRYKGMDVVLRALVVVREAIPDVRLVCVGRGDDRDRLATLAASLGLDDAVQFAGFVEEKEKLRWLRRAQLVVYPSPKEGWGIAALEAQACGTPVLASDVEGLCDVVCDGVTGFLVPHRDPDAWARRVIEVLQNPSLRASLGSAARDWASRFDWDVEADKMLAVVSDVARGRGG